MTTTVSSQKWLFNFFKVKGRALTVLLTIHRVSSYFSLLSLFLSFLSSRCDDDDDAPSYQSLVSLARPRHDVRGALSFRVFPLSLLLVASPFLVPSFSFLSFALSRVLGGNTMQTRHSSLFFSRSFFLAPFYKPYNLLVSPCSCVHFLTLFFLLTVCLILATRSSRALSGKPTRNSRTHRLLLARMGPRGYPTDSRLCFSLDNFRTPVFAAGNVSMSACMFALACMRARLLARSFRLRARTRACVYASRKCTYAWPVHACERRPARTRPRFSFSRLPIVVSLLFLAVARVRFLQKSTGCFRWTVAWLTSSLLLLRRWYSYWKIVVRIYQPFSFFFFFAKRRWKRWDQRMNRRCVSSCPIYIYIGD